MELMCVASQNLETEHICCAIASYKDIQAMSKKVFTLLYLPFCINTPKPCFRPQAKAAEISKLGFVLYYSHQCPFIAKYVPLLEEAAGNAGIPFETIRIDSREKAQNVPVIVTNFSIYYNGKFVTYEILSVGKFEKRAKTLTKSKEETK